MQYILTYVVSGVTGLSSVVFNMVLSAYCKHAAIVQLYFNRKNLMGTWLRFGLFIHVSGPIRQVANRCLA